jgi:hypothetical protein
MNKFPMPQPPLPFLHWKLGEQMVVLAKNVRYSAAVSVKPSLGRR